MEANTMLIEAEAEDGAGFASLDRSHPILPKVYPDRREGMMTQDLVAYPAATVTAEAGEKALALSPTSRPGEVL